MNVVNPMNILCGVRRVGVKAFGATTEAMKMGKPYQTRLDPAPGPPADAEGDFLSLPEWKPSDPRPANWPPHIHAPRIEET